VVEASSVGVRTTPAEEKRVVVDVRLAPEILKLCPTTHLGVLVKKMVKG